jgi:hypothetical protein
VLVAATEYVVPKTKSAATRRSGDAKRFRRNFESLRIIFYFTR